MAIENVEETAGNNNQEFIKNHQAGFCLKPKELSRMPFLSVPRQFMIPARVDDRDRCGPTEDQGNKPMCAAYAAANWAENILWRKKDCLEQIQPEWIYAYAKMHDGMPDQDGTTLNWVLEALRGTLFDRDDTKVRIVRNSRLSVKYALHKFGCILMGFQVTDEWYEKNKEDSFITGEEKLPFLGAHAVLGCGFDKEGVWIQNSWGAEKFGRYGFAKISWAEFDRAHVYSAVLAGCLNGLDINT